MDSSKSLKDYGEFEEVWPWIQKVCMVRIKPVWAIQWDLYQRGHKIKTTQGDISCWACIYPWIFCFHRRQQGWLHTGAPFLKMLHFTLALAFGGGVATAAASIIPRRHREHSRTSFKPCLHPSWHRANLDRSHQRGKESMLCTTKIRAMKSSEDYRPLLNETQRLSRTQTVSRPLFFKESSSKYDQVMSGLWHKQLKTGTFSQGSLMRWPP